VKGDGRAVALVVPSTWRWLSSGLTIRSTILDDLTHIIEDHKDERDIITAQSV